MNGIVRNLKPELTSPHKHTYIGIGTDLTEE